MNNNITITSNDESKQSLLVKPSIMATSSVSITSPISSPPTTTSPSPPFLKRRLSLLPNPIISITIPPKLHEKLLGDVLVALGVTLGVTPFMTVVDKAIVQRAAGTHTIIHSSIGSIRQMIRNPVAYVRSPMFLMMWGVYAATYTTANSLKTITEHGRYNSYNTSSSPSTTITFQNNNEQTTNNTTNKSNSSTWSIFVGTTVVNSLTTLMKDRAYATMFGTTGSAPKVPLVSYGLWSLRDGMVIGSSFIMPDIVSRHIEELITTDENDNRRDTARRISQFICPVGTQFVAGPVQLLGLDFYNRPLAHLTSTWEAMRERVVFVGRGFFSIVGARIARIAPAYGIGGIGNTYFREEWREMLIRREIEKIMRQDGMIDRDQGRKNAEILVDLVSKREVER